MADVLHLDPDPASVRHARAWAHGVVIDLDAAQVADTAELLVSELVSNVVLHARTACTVSIARHDGLLRIEVADDSPRAPAARGRPDPLALSGRGMALVEGLSSAHGITELEQGGKVVWLELPVAPTPAP